MLLSVRELCVVLLSEEFGMIQAFLLGLCSEHSINRSVRSDARTRGKMLQEEAEVTDV